MAHLKVEHGPAPTVEQLTCPTCSKVFKVLKTMWEHMASHKGPFHCRVKGCSAGLFLSQKCLNRQMGGETQILHKKIQVQTLVWTGCTPVQTMHKKIPVTCAVTPCFIFGIISMIEGLSKGCSFDGWSMFVQQYSRTNNT